MEMEKYVRIPFTTDAVEITRENIEEVAELVGDIKYLENGDPYILVDPRLVKNVKKVYLGFFMTKLGKNVRCYSAHVFKSTYTQHTDEVQGWIDYLTGGNDK